jgi:Thioredoxin
MRNVLETGRYRNKVRNYFIGGVRSGVNGTPTFFINGVRHDGPYDYASLVSGIQMRPAVDTRTYRICQEALSDQRKIQKRPLELTMVSAAPRSGDYARSYA